MSAIFWVILLSMAPISELRGGIPFAIQNGFHPVAAYFICVSFNALVSPLLYFFLNTVNKLLLKWTFYKNIFEKLVERARNKLHDKVEKYGFWGITLFVAIPLPVTGAITGTLGGWVLGLEKKKIFLASLVGVMIAGVVVTTVWLLGRETLGFLVDLFASGRFIEQN
ncbi:MAG: small multi-drug export protein [Spirochaetales bacterium]|nr:small multi-drug export protein [Spirochaetales bacterium]